MADQQSPFDTLESTFRLLCAGPKPLAVDGRELGLRGYSSPTTKIRLSRGPHRVLLELEGYKPVEQVIQVILPQKFTFTLERAPARLEVKSPGTNDTARGAELFIDGAPAGTVPVPVEVPSGRHLVEVRKPGATRAEAYALIQRQTKPPSESD